MMAANKGDAEFELSSTLSGVEEPKLPKFIRGDYIIQVFLQYGNKFICK